MKRTAWKIENSAFLPRRLEVLVSPAWKNAPRALKALLEELEIEHLRHRGLANGNLFRSYSQFVEAGFNRTTVATFTRMAESLGLLKVNRQTGIGRPDLRDACSYTLTYLPTGTARNVPPTDDWKRIKSDEQALAIIERCKPAKKNTVNRKRKEAA